MNVPGAMPEVEVLEPLELKGDYIDAVSFKVNWTEEFKREYQEVKRYGEQIGFCMINGEPIEVPVTYPDVASDYMPPNECIQSAGNRINLQYFEVVCIILIASKFY